MLYFLSFSSITIPQGVDPEKFEEEVWQKVVKKCFQSRLDSIFLQIVFSRQDECIIGAQNGIFRFDIKIEDGLPLAIQEYRKLYNYVSPLDSKVEEIYKVFIDNNDDFYYCKEINFQIRDFFWLNLKIHEEITEYWYNLKIAEDDKLSMIIIDIRDAVLKKYNETKFTPNLLNKYIQINDRELQNKKVILIKNLIEEKNNLINNDCNLIDFGVNIEDYFKNFLFQKDLDIYKLLKLFKQKKQIDKLSELIKLRFMKKLDKLNFKYKSPKIQNIDENILNQINLIINNDKYLINASEIQITNFENNVKELFSYIINNMSLFFSQLKDINYINTIKTLSSIQEEMIFNINEIAEEYKNKIYKEMDEPKRFLKITIPKPVLYIGDKNRHVHDLRKLQKDLYLFFFEMYNADLFNRLENLNKMYKKHVKLLKTFLHEKYPKLFYYLYISEIENFSSLKSFIKIFTIYDHDLFFNEDSLEIKYVKKRYPRVYQVKKIQIYIELVKKSLQMYNLIKTDIDQINENFKKIFLIQSKADKFAESIKKLQEYNFTTKIVTKSQEISDQAKKYEAYIRQVGYKKVFDKIS